jgi:hypothetical protein
MENFDVCLLGDCDIIVSAICKALQWELDEEKIPDNELESTFIEPNTYLFKGCVINDYSESSVHETTDLDDQTSDDEVSEDDHLAFLLQDDFVRPVENGVGNDLALHEELPQDPSSDVTEKAMEHEQSLIVEPFEEENAAVEADVEDDDE